jgi:hypothetical protein
MAALAKDRNTAQWGDDAQPALCALPVRANTQIFGGSLVVSDGGYAAPARTATGLLAAGVAIKQFDNRTATTGGVAGALTATVRKGVFKFDNSAAGDAVTQANFGALCYAVDDHTVALTAGGGTRSIAGVIEGVDADGGVWVKVGCVAVAAA